MVPLPLLILAASMFLGLRSEKQQQAARAAQPKATPEQKAEIMQMVRELTGQQPVPPKDTVDKMVRELNAQSAFTPAAQEQADVDAAVSKAVRTELKRNLADSAVEVGPAEIIPTEVVSSPAVAAQRLAVFLTRTNRFGSKVDHPEEIKTAQRDLKVAADGVVGPKTRAAAKKAGTVLPMPRKVKS